MTKLNFKNLLNTYLITSDLDEMTVNNLTFNSKEVTPNTLFICKGATFKKEYLLQAIQLGAVGYVSEIDYEVDIPKVIVSNIREVMPILADAFYQHPQDQLHIIGITGTKGKSSTSYMVNQILSHGLNQPQALLSSITTFSGDEELEAHLTTPESLDVFKHLDNARKHQLQFITMEVSSQALKYNRVDLVPFEIGIFLNISYDHISDKEHPTFEDYFQSKLRLFKQSKVAIISKDSDYFEKILEHAHQCQKVITVSLHDPSAGYFADNIQTVDQGQTFTLNGETIYLNLMGEFNVENALLAIAVADYYQLDRKQVIATLNQIQIPGRMEVFRSSDKPITVIVDYAHNALSFQKLFESTVKQFPHHQIFSIFGSAGRKALNRRQDLSVLADKFSDRIYLTEEDPGTEDPMKICMEMASHIKNKPYDIVIHRREAFKKALADAQHQPTVILYLGKGDETTQKLGNEYVDYPSDKQNVIDLL